MGPKCRQKYLFCAALLSLNAFLVFLAPSMRKHVTSLSSNVSGSESPINMPEQSWEVI